MKKKTLNVILFGMCIALHGQALKAMDDAEKPQEEGERVTEVSMAAVYVRATTNYEKALNRPDLTDKERDIVTKSLSETRLLVDRRFSAEVIAQARERNERQEEEDAQRREPRRKRREIHRELRLGRELVPDCRVN